MKFVSWDEFVALSKKLALSLNSENFDSIICINRGGLVLGRILSDVLGLPLGVVSAKSYEVGKANSYKETVVDESISIVGDVGQSVLLVDDIADSGSTFAKLVHFLEKTRGLSVKTAVIFKKKKCEYDVDFFVSDGVDDWIVMPYETEEFGGCGKL